MCRAGRTDHAANVPTARETSAAIERASGELAVRYPLPGDVDQDPAIGCHDTQRTDLGDSTRDGSGRDDITRDDPLVDATQHGEVPLSFPDQVYDQPFSDPDTHRTIGPALDRSGSGSGTERRADHVVAGVPEQERRDQLVRWHAEDHPADDMADGAGDGDTAVAREW